MLLRDKIFPLGMSAGEDSQPLVCSLQLLLSLLHLQHHSLTLARHREHPCAPLPPLLLALPYSSPAGTPLFQSALDLPSEHQG